MTHKIILTVVENNQSQKIEFTSRPNQTPQQTLMNLYQLYMLDRGKNTFNLKHHFNRTLPDDEAFDVCFGIKDNKRFHWNDFSTCIP